MKRTLLLILLVVTTATSAAQVEVMTHQDKQTSTTFSLAWNPRTDVNWIAVGRATEVCEPDFPQLYDIQVIDVTTNQTVKTLSGSTCTVSALDWNSDGTKLASASQDAVGIRVWDIATGQLLTTAEKHGQGASSVKWRPPHNDQLATGGIGNGIAILDATTGQSADHSPIGGGPVDWSPDGTKLLSGSSYDNQVYVADMLSGQQIMALSGHTEGVSSVTWSPNGHKFASASRDQTIRIWDADTGSPLMLLQGHTDEVYNLAWNADSHRLASASRDGTVRVWDIVTGQQISVFRENKPVYAVAWSQTGDELVYAGDDDSLQFVSATQIGT